MSGWVDEWIFRSTTNSRSSRTKSESENSIFGSLLVRLQHRWQVNVWFVKVAKRTQYCELKIWLMICELFQCQISRVSSWTFGHDDFDFLWDAGAFSRCTRILVQLWDIDNAQDGHWRGHSCCCRRDDRPQGHGHVMVGQPYELAGLMMMAIQPVAEYGCWVRLAISKSNLFCNVFGPTAFKKWQRPAIKSTHLNKICVPLAIPESARFCKISIKIADAFFEIL